MVPACLHIKPNGVRCESPAPRGHAFCYFHSQLRSTAGIGIRGDFKLPLREDAAAAEDAFAPAFCLNHAPEA